MTSETFVDTVEGEVETELSRLGSSRSLYADTGGEMDTENVLGVAATAELSAAETFDAWAETETGPIGELFAAVTDREHGHYESILNECADPDAYEPGETPPVHQYLRDCEGTTDRLGAFVGRTLAADRSNAHMSGFFIGQGDTEVGTVFEQIGDDLDAQLTDALALLETHCGDDEDCWEQATDAAVDATQAAYQAYVDGLKALGVDPKPICD